MKPESCFQRRKNKTICVLPLLFVACIQCRFEVLGDGWSALPMPCDTRRRDFPLPLPIQYRIFSIVPWPSRRFRILWHCEAGNPWVRLESNTLRQLIPCFSSRKHHTNTKENSTHPRDAFFPRKTILRSFGNALRLAKEFLDFPKKTCNWVRWRLIAATREIGRAS